MANVVQRVLLKQSPWECFAKVLKKNRISPNQFLNFDILGGFLLRKKHAFRTSATNRASSLRYRFGTACGRCSNSCHSLNRQGNQHPCLQTLQFDRRRNQNCGSEGGGTLKKDDFSYKICYIFCQEVLP